MRKNQALINEKNPPANIAKSGTFKLQWEVSKCKMIAHRLEGQKSNENWIGVISYRKKVVLFHLCEHAFVQKGVE